MLAVSDKKGNLVMRIWKVAKGYPWGEASLWLMFVLFALGASAGNDAAATVAGVSALAAIGVRATRVPRAGSDSVG